MVHLRARARQMLWLAVSIGAWACGGDEDDGETGPTSDAGSDAEVTADGAPPPMADVGVRCARDDQCPEGEYCPEVMAGEVALCQLGCREGGCPIGERCNTAAQPRFCERDPSCAEDGECFPGEYCDGDECRDGCRLDDPEACPRTMNGEPRACDPATRTCQVQVVCCGGDDSCSLALPDACDDAIPGLLNCVNPNPCALRCGEDLDCDEASYCGADGFCAEGCRDAPGACGRDRVCALETRQCIRPPCATDAECTPSQFCSLDVCLPGCRRDPDNCPRGEVCNEANRCVPEEGPDEPCPDDAACDAENPGWICEDGVCEPPCAGHGECADDLACIGGRCVEGCRDDRYEENDAREDAPPLDFDGNRFADDALYACRRDADWYRFETPSAGTSIQVVVGFTHADGDIDARLHAPDGRVVAAGDSSDDDETLSYLAGPGNPSPAGTWWVEVYARGIDENAYSLDIELSGAIGPDDAEVDDAPVTATSLSLPDEQQSVTIGDRTIHPNDEDWFALDMGARDGLQVRLEMLGNGTGANDDLDFEIYGPGAPAPGEPPAAVPNGGGGGVDGPRFVQFDAPRFNAQIVDGRYYIRVSGLDRARFGRYRITIAVDRDGVLCLPDDSEPNDVAQTAFDLMSVGAFVRPGIDGTLELRPEIDLTLPGRTLCAEEDWYSLTLRPGDALEVRAERLEPEIVGDTIIELRDPFGALIQSGRSGQRINVARFDEAAGGRYLVRIQAAAEVRTGYDLDVLRTAGPIACDPDAFDADGGNDVRVSASPVDPGRYAGLTLCGALGDTDWFSFETDTLATIEVAARFPHVQGDLELDLYYEGDPVSLNAELPDGHSADDDEVVRFANRAPGLYFVRVSGLGDPTVRYDLEVNVEERIFVCEDDPDEPNTDFAAAELLGRNEVDREAQWLCVRAPRDVDTFLFTVPPGEPRAVATSFVYGDDGDLYVEVFDDDEMLRASTAEIARGNSKQCVVIEQSDVNRTFFVRVLPLSINTVGQADERLDYRLRIANDDDCENLPPETPGVVWPRIVD